MKKTKQLILALLPQFIFLSASAALPDTIEDSGISGSAIGQGSLGIISPKLRNYRWQLEGQARFSDNADDFNQGIIRTGLGYTFMENTVVWLGYAWIRTSPPGKADFDENRIWQQLTWSTKLKPVTLASRTRLEQRFVEATDDTGWRFRQLFKLVYPFPFEPRLSLTGYDEIFLNLNSTDWGDRQRFRSESIICGIWLAFWTKPAYKSDNRLSQSIRPQTLGR